MSLVVQGFSGPCITTAGWGSPFVNGLPIGDKPTVLLLPVLAEASLFLSLLAMTQADMPVDQIVQLLLPVAQRTQLDLPILQSALIDLPIC